MAGYRYYFPSQSDPGLDTPSLSYSPMSQGPHTAGIPLDYSAFVTDSPTEDLSPVQSSSETTDTMKVLTESEKGDHTQDDEAGSIITNPFASSADADIPKFAMAQPYNHRGILTDPKEVTCWFWAHEGKCRLPEVECRHAHRWTGVVADYPFLSSAERDRLFRGTLGYPSRPYAEYGNHTNDIGPGNGNKFIYTNPPSYVNPNMNTAGNTNVNMATTVTSANDMAAAANTNIASYTQDNISTGHAHNMDVGVDDRGNGLTYGPAQLVSNWGGPYGMNPYTNPAFSNHGLSGSFNANMHSPFSGAAHMTTPVLNNATMNHVLIPKFEYPVSENNPSEMKHWGNPNMAHVTPSGYQDPFTLRSHVAPNPLATARSEVQKLKQRLYRTNQELERATRTFRSHIEESGKEAERMTQMIARIEDNSQLPAIKRGLGLLCNDIKTRLRRGRAVTFANETPHGPALGFKSAPPGRRSHPR